MNVRNEARVGWADLETQRRLNVAISEKLEQKSRVYEDSYDAGRRERREVAHQKDQVIKAGLLLIFPTVLGVALTTALGPAALLAGAACGAGVLLSLKRHDVLCKKEDAVEHRSEQMWYERARARLDAHQYTREAEKLQPQVDQAWGRLQEYEGVARLGQHHNGGSVEETHSSVIVGGIRLPRARSDFSVLDRRALNERWLVYDPIKAGHFPDQPPFISGARVAFALSPQEVVEGSVTFKSRFESAFTVRTDDGRTLTGSTNDLARGESRLWLT